MKKIKDFTKLIGIIGRGGNFFPSNEKSEVKWKNVYKVAGIEARTLINRTELRWFREKAKEQGYIVFIQERGLNR